MKEKMTKKQTKEFVLSVLKHKGNCDYITDKTSLLKDLRCVKSRGKFCVCLCPLHTDAATNSNLSYEERAFISAQQYWYEHYPEEQEVLLEVLV